MSDFDFDEIDKAVHSALGATPSKSLPEATEADASTNTIIPDATPVKKPPVAATPALVQAPATAPIQAAAPAARRSTGRFMDMVVNPAPAVKVTPQPEETVLAAPVPTPTIAPVQDITPIPKPAPQVSESAEEPTQAIPSFELELEEDDWSRPLESPFIADAKVEKRPLGGEAPTATDLSSDFDASEFLEAPDDPRIEAHTMPDPIDFAEQSQSTTEAANEPEEIPLPDLTLHNDESVDEKKEPDAVRAYSSTSVQASDAQPHSSESIQPIGPASISQQYIEKPSAPAETGAMYDVEPYRQPLTHVPKKHAGVWVVVWIILLVLFGGGAGAAVYFFVLPLL